MLLQLVVVNLIEHKSVNDHSLLQGILGSSVLGTQAATSGTKRDKLITEPRKERDTHKVTDRRPHSK